MNLETKKGDGGVLLVKPLEKSIEAGNSRDFKNQLIGFINDGNSTLVLNLSCVEFMDSSGLGSLISILKLLNAEKGKLIICETNDQVNRLFTLTRLHQVFQFFKKEEEAFNSLKTPAS